MTLKPLNGRAAALDLSSAPPSRGTGGAGRIRSDQSAARQGGQAPQARVGTAALTLGDSAPCTRREGTGDLTPPVASQPHRHRCGQVAKPACFAAVTRERPGERGPLTVVRRGAMPVRVITLPRDGLADLAD